MVEIQEVCHHQTTAHAQILPRNIDGNRRNLQCEIGTDLENIKIELLVTGISCKLIWLFVNLLNRINHTRTVVGTFLEIPPSIEY